MFIAILLCFGILIALFILAGFREVQSGTIPRKIFGAVLLLLGLAGAGTLIYGFMQRLNH